MFRFGGLIVIGGFLTPGGAADFGWFAYTALLDAVHSPGAGGDMWIVGLIMSGFGTILGSVDFIVTVSTLRAPGMTMFRLPIFTWNVFVTGGRGPPRRSDPQASYSPLRARHGSYCGAG